MRANPDKEAAFGAALGNRGFGKHGAPAKVLPINAAAAHPLPTAPGPNELVLGRADNKADVLIDLTKLLEGRMLLQGVSGAGKSWTLRRLLEQSAGRIQQLIIDPEGEFRSLADELGYLYIEVTKLSGAAIAELARRARRHRTSLVLDLSERTREEQMVAVSAFLASLIECPRDDWHPALVAIDEAHLFAPFGGQSAASTAVRKAAIGAVVDLMSRGRKRGLAGVLATQRLARLSKSVASEVQNFLIGLNTLDLDVKRAAETIGWDARRAYDRLPMLRPGDFVATGPAFSGSPISLRVGPVKSRHVGATPALLRLDQVSAGQAKELLDVDQLEAASQEVLDEAGLQPGFRAVRAFIRDDAFPLAGRIFDALRGLAPDGVEIDDLAQHLEVDPAQISAAVALLESYRAVQIRGRSARVTPKFLSEEAR
jgi:uncharacterized protein